MSQTGVREGTGEPTYAQILATLGRIEEKLNGLTGPKGRLSNIEDDICAHQTLLEAHERKIQRAHGALGILALLWGLAEAYFHKLMGK